MNTLFLISYGVLWLLVLLLIGVSILLLRQFGVVYLKSAGGVSRGGVSIGTRVADIQIPLLGGGRALLSQTSATQTLIAFTSPKCAPCRLLLPHLARLAVQVESTRIILVVQDATPEEATAFVAELPTSIQVASFEDRSLFEEVFKGEVTPFAFCLDQERKVVRKGLANDIEDLLHLTGARLPSADSVA